VCLHNRIMPVLGHVGYFKHIVVSLALEDPAVVLVWLHHIYTYDVNARSPYAMSVSQSVSQAISTISTQTPIYLDTSPRNA
jgi:hypothetical protein